MPGHILKCGKCGALVRVGYPSLAVDYAEGFGRTESREQLVEDFFELNPGVLRGEPEKCPKCGAPRKELTAIHSYL